MGKIRFSEAAIKANYLVENPDWYEYEITNVVSKPTQAGDSNNNFVTFEGRSGEMQGVPVTIMFNDKADWTYLPLFTVAVGREITAEDEFEWDDLKGIKLQAMTKR